MQEDIFKKKRHSLEGIYGVNNSFPLLCEFPQCRNKMQHKPFSKVTLKSYNWH